MADASHPLQDPWTFWLDRKVGPIRTDSDPVTYVDNLKKLSEMHTVEEFTNAYRHMIRAVKADKWGAVLNRHTCTRQTKVHRCGKTKKKYILHIAHICVAFTPYRDAHFLRNKKL
eukprot:GEMP01056082.1.p1 GENE.GEMP01056082.1~~GEMP01056082.1.p1  ORF type:complete len:115 (+),score=16.17 GEMP01056082.1:99-443(+)